MGEGECQKGARCQRVREVQARRHALGRWPNVAAEEQEQQEQEEEEEEKKQQSKQQQEQGCVGGVYVCATRATRA